MASSVRDSRPSAWASITSKSVMLCSKIRPSAVVRRSKIVFRGKIEKRLGKLQKPRPALVLFAENAVGKLQRVHFRVFGEQSAVEPVDALGPERRPIPHVGEQLFQLAPSVRAFGAVVLVVAQINQHVPKDLRREAQLPAHVLAIPSFRSRPWTEFFALVRAFRSRWQRRAAGR